MVHRCALGKGHGAPSGATQASVSIKLSAPTARQTPTQTVGKIVEVRTVICDGVQKVSRYEDGVRVSSESYAVPEVKKGTLSYRVG